MSGNTLQFEHNKKWALLPIDIVYYILFGITYCYFFLKTTLLYSEFLKDYNSIFYDWINILSIAMFCLSVFTILFICDGIKNRLLLSGILILALLYLFNREIDSDLKSIYLTLTLLICSYKKNYKVLLITSFLTGWVIVILSILASVTGKIPFYVYQGTRHGLGSIYPTDLGCHILILCMSHCILRYKKMNLFDYLWLMIVFVVDFQIIQAKVSSVCLLVLIGGCLFNAVVLSKSNISLFTKRIFSFIAIAIYPLLTGITLFLTIIYNKIPVSIISKLGSIGSRLRLGRDAFDKYEISAWGQYIHEVGAGGKPVDHADYFFLDISYVRILFMNGLVIFITVILVYIILQVRLVRAGKYFIAFSMILFAIDCAIEHHMVEIAYGYVLMMLAFINLKSLPKIKKTST